MKYSLFRRHTLIRQVPAFSRLSWLDLQRIAFNATLIKFKKGEIIRSQGDPADALYCLVSGRIQAYVLDQRRKTHVEFFRRGMYFGIVSLLTGENHSMTFEAQNDSLILRIEKKYFHRMIQVLPQLGLEFSHTLSHRIRRRLTQREQATESAIISVYSPTRGAGASTFAVNFALSLARESHRGVILVNFDSRSETIAPGDGRKDVRPRWKSPGVLLNIVNSDPAAVSQHIVKGGPQTDLLNVFFDPQDPSLVELISQFVTTLTVDYRFVVVDLPTERDHIVLKTLSQSDLLVLIAHVNQEGDYHGARQVIDKLEEELKENFKEENVFLLVSGNEPVANSPLDEISKKIDFDVSARLPHIKDEELGPRLATAAMEIDLPNMDSPYARAVTSLARKVSGVQVGLVLGGGAALGIAHIGVMRVLEREKIPIDIVVGSSMGALLASLWVTGKDSQGIEKLAREFRTRSSIWKLFDPVIPVSGIIGGKMIKKWLAHRQLGDKTFYDTRIPLKIVAYDLLKRREIVISSGSLVDAVRKSIAIPGIIEPVLEEEKVIIDGGVLNPLPTNVLRDAGVKKIIAVNVLQSPYDVGRSLKSESDRLQHEREISFRQNPLRFLKSRLSSRKRKPVSPTISDLIVRSLLSSEYLIAERSAEVADVVIHPDLGGVDWYELYKVDELIKRGEEATEAVLPQIRKLCEL